MSDAMGITKVNWLCFSSGIHGSECHRKGNPYFCDIKQKKMIGKEHGNGF